MPIHSMGIMEEDRNSKMSAIKDQIERGEYHVDPALVADAILRRLGVAASPPLRVCGDSVAVRVLPGGKTSPPGSETSRIQKACSYPASGPSASVNTTPPSPCVTDPTQVRPGPMLAIASRLRAAAAGAQIQIS